MRNGRKITQKPSKTHTRGKGRKSSHAYELFKEKVVEIERRKTTIFKDSMITSCGGNLK